MPDSPVPIVMGIESLCLFIAQFQETLRAKFLVLIAHYIRNLQSRRTRAFRIWKDVQLGDRQALQELIAFLEALRCLTTTSLRSLSRISFILSLLPVLIVTEMLREPMR